MTLGPSYLGIQVIEDGYLPEGQMLAIGDFERPEGWDAMTEGERMTYALAHGAALHVQNIGAFRARLGASA